MMKWISVKKKLPEKVCNVLVAAGRHITLAGWNQEDGWELDREDRAFGITSTTITHWMPLPEPPNEDEQ